jgi:probable HAF family extracellular repeat protein
MKSKLLVNISFLSLLTLLAMPLRVVAQEGQREQSQQLQRYTVTDLGPVGNPFSQANYVNNPGQVTGLDTAADGSQHAVLWYEGLFKDISQPGLGGPNSGAGGANDFGQVIGGAETSEVDPNNENFCGYGTGLQCLAFLWENGVMTALPTLGGTNASWGQINNRGEIAGYAEEDKADPDCPGTVAVNGLGPQILYFEPVIWGPKPSEIRRLNPLKGDSVGIAFSINDESQAVGMSGTCANTVLPGPAASAHAVLWEKDGTVRDLGNLGGTVNPQVLADGNAAFLINNYGQVAGVSALPEIKSAECPGDPPNPNCFPFHPFLWTPETGMQDLGVLPGDFVGAGLGLNNKGEVVGPSISAPGLAAGNPRVFLWRDGVMHDLNSLVPPDSPLYLLIAYAINDAGQIAGFGADNNGDIHAFLATPSNQDQAGTDLRATPPEGAAAERAATPERPRPVLSESARKQLQKMLRFHLAGPQPTQPQ